MAGIPIKVSKERGGFSYKKPTDKDVDMRSRVSKAGAGTYYKRPASPKPSRFLEPTVEVEDYTKSKWYRAKGKEDIEDEYKKKEIIDIGGGNVKIIEREIYLTHSGKKTVGRAQRIQASYEPYIKSEMIVDAQGNILSEKKYGVVTSNLSRGKKTGKVKLMSTWTPKRETRQTWSKSGIYRGFQVLDPFSGQKWIDAKKKGSGLKSTERKTGMTNIQRAKDYTKNLQVPKTRQIVGGVKPTPVNVGPVTGNVYAGRARGSSISPFKIQPKKSYNPAGIGKLQWLEQRGAKTIYQGKDVTGFQDRRTMGDVLKPFGGVEKKKLADTEFYDAKIRGKY